MKKSFVIITAGKFANRLGFVEKVFPKGMLGIVGGNQFGDRYEALISPDDIEVLHDGDNRLGDALLAAKWFYRYDIPAKRAYIANHDNCGLLASVIVERANLLNELNK